MTPFWKGLTIWFIAFCCVFYVVGQLFAAHANAAGRVCGERDSLAKFLKKRYGELPTAMGVASTNKSVMEIYVSEKGTWTVLMTVTTGMACIMGAGHSWEKRETVGRKT